MIIPESLANNHRQLFLLPVTVFLLTLGSFFGGCGGEKSPGEQKGETPENCQVHLDTTAWQVFDDLGRRSAAGETLTSDDYQVFADLPIVTIWKNSMSFHLSSIRIVSWLESAFEPDAADGNRKPSSDRVHFSRNYQYSLSHLDEIQSRIQDFQDQGRGCSLKEKANFWLGEKDVPDSLVVAIIPSKPELRNFENYLFVDSGVLWAGSPEQLEGQLVGLLFRSLRMLEGASPGGAQGKIAVANSIRVMMNEGILGYIEDQPGTTFNPDHAKLGAVNIVPEVVYEHGRRAIDLFETHLPEMMADPAVMTRKGRNLAKTLIASSSLNQGGYCMSATIAGHLGEDRLRDTAGSPSAWLKAYQEAALLNGKPAPDPYQFTQRMYRCMAPFDDSVFEGLIRICDEVFQ